MNLRYNFLFVIFITFSITAYSQTQKDTINAVEAIHQL